jgi:hypothetical protein
MKNLTVINYTVKTGVRKGINKEQKNKYEASRINT